MHSYRSIQRNLPAAVYLVLGQIAEAHGGSLELSNRPDERGCRVRVILPRPVG